ncbi:SnoaL-like domain-containing protein [Ekhidna lutea]|uniref:SnoaL-like domain-containing protein n=1 Tax=Ekhidna lutea TaxID=447679 RepID=A0A239HAP4_EKHLU|nr:SnoaL-like domain-containing protein [Ekhidna lutea]SNS78205.1 SnoaL-like domain-containing protein [Ekhidna lutea]
MKNLQEKINDLNDLVLQGKALDAFEKYYADDVVMQENEAAPTLGKSANRKREIEFLNNITDFRSAIPAKITVGENTTMVEWHYDYTHKEWGVRKYSQISVQEWENEKIIREKFYYNT